MHHPPTVSDTLVAMGFVEILVTYFRGEKQLGIAVAVAGVALAAFCAYFARSESGSFATAMLIPFGLVAVACIGGGPFLAIRSDRQIEELSAMHARDPAALVAAEVPRMDKVNANWPRLKAAWTVGIVLALVLIHGAKREWSTGLGMALLVIFALVFTIDVFAERRAEIYTRALFAERDALDGADAGP